jgi:hypothetical protein
MTLLSMPTERFFLFNLIFIKFTIKTLKKYIAIINFRNE